MFTLESNDLGTGTRADRILALMHEFWMIACLHEQRKDQVADKKD